MATLSQHTKGPAVGLHTFYKTKMTPSLLFSEKVHNIAQIVFQWVPNWNILKQLKNIAMMIIANHHELMKSCAYHKVTYENIVVNTGRSELAKFIAGTSVATGGINYVALGDSSATPVVGDTQLGNETFRKAVSSVTVSNQTVTVNHSYGSSEAVDQHYEAGEFIGASAAANSGILFARWNIDENKSSGETLTIESTYKITQ